LATNPGERPEERQRRELEEIRRKFQEVGARVGSMFEPAAPDDPQPPALLPPAPPPLDQPTRPRWQLVAAMVLILLLGTGLGYLLPRSGAGAQPAPTPAPTSRPPSSAQAPSTRAAQPGPASRPVVPPACLETARRGDEVVHLLMTNVRNRRLAEALKAYTLASQACREEASP
jgi:hypothetical protein